MPTSTTLDVRSAVAKVLGEDLVRGISLRLESTMASVRADGMRIAEARVPVLLGGTTTGISAAADGNGDTENGNSGNNEAFMCQDIDGER